MGVFKRDSWKKASVYDPATGDVALMTTLIGGDTFLAPQEEITQETTNGNYLTGYRHRVQIASSDWDAYATLVGFVAAHTKVQAVASAESLNCANLQWYESVKIKSLHKVPKPRRADGDSHFIVILEFEGDENAAIFNNVNLLHQVNVSGKIITGWVDNDGDGVADGYTKAGGTGTFALSTQSISASADIIFLNRSIKFPIFANKLTLSVDRIKLHGFGANQLLSSLTQFNESEVAAFVSVISSTGRRVLESLVTSPSFYMISIRIARVANITALDEVQEKNPCLRTDGSSEYIAG